MNLLHLHLHLHHLHLLLLAVLLTAQSHPAAATALAIDPSTTPGFATLDICIQLCFTGDLNPHHGLGARVGCATKACVCGGGAQVDEYMETCARVSCARPRRLEWWKRGAWRRVFERYCEGVWGEEMDGAEGGVW